MAELRQTGSRISENQHQRKDGSIFPVETNVNYVRLDRDYVLAVTRDITRRKEAETSLRQREAQLRHIIDTVPEGVILLDAKGNIYLTNPIAEQFLVVLASERENGRLTHLGNRPLNELLTSPPKGLWHEVTSKDRVFEAIARPVENSSHNGGWVLVLRDVTQERDIQRQVQRQERLAAVGQLAAGIAHDFNNILAVINLYAQLISRTVEMPARAQEEIHTIEQQVKRATDLIQQVLDFSRQSVLERRPFDLLPFMEKLVTLLKRTLPEHIQIELNHDVETYFIQADPSRMQQVMMNLAVNARDAMPEGGRLQIRLTRMQTEEAKPMPVQDLPPGKWIQIEVSDSGDGIPSEAFSHIFEPFFTTKAEGRGTGLGLAQVYGIVQQHGGYIDVATEIGQGTTFFLYFPVLNTGENTTDVSDKSALPLGQGQRVLVVEDDPTIRKALQSSLAVLNYEVMVAANGREALTILATRADEVDLVLSDAVMPEMGGIALFHAMQEQYPTIPVVLLTGHPLSKEMESLQILGLAGWLPKPPDLTSLSYLLAKALKETNKVVPPP
jgi:signal transduction histidine kinase/ActR/RegA family two-component response regulator